MTIEVIDDEVFYAVLCHPDQELPFGWSWGPRWSSEAGEGRYAIAESGPVVPIRFWPDHAFMRDTFNLAEYLDSALWLTARMRETQR